MRILIVDSEESSGFPLERLLKLEGYAVRWVRTIAEAHAVCDSETFDLLISDLNLVDGSGLDLMRDLARRCGVKGIALTGSAMEEDVAESAAAGFTIHLSKPIPFQNITDAIRRVGPASN